MTNGEIADQIIKRIYRERLAQPEQKWHSNWRKIWRSAIIDELARCQKEAHDGTERAKAIFQLYPRKIAHLRAYQAIEKAIKTHGYQHIEERTEAYAKAVATWSMDWRFSGSGGRDIVPHPASWFNAGSYDDDPKEWIGDRKYNVVTTPKKKLLAPPSWQTTFLIRYDDWEGDGNGVKRIADGKYFGWDELPQYIKEDMQP